MEPPDLVGGWRATMTIPSSASSLCHTSPWSLGLTLDVWWLALQLTPWLLLNKISMVVLLGVSNFPEHPPTSTHMSSHLWGFLGQKLWSRYGVHTFKDNREWYTLTWSSLEWLTTGKARSNNLKWSWNYNWWIVKNVNRLCKCNECSSDGTGQNLSGSFPV